MRYTKLALPYLVDLIVISAVGALYGALTGDASVFWLVAAVLFVPVIAYRIPEAVLMRRKRARLQEPTTVRLPVAATRKPVADA